MQFVKLLQYNQSSLLIKAIKLLDNTVKQAVKSGSQSSCKIKQSIKQLNKAIKLLDNTVKQAVKPGSQSSCKTKQ